MNKRLLDILRCPVTGKPLRLLEREELDALNRQITAGELEFSGGDRPESAFDEALITDDSEWIYAVTDGVPVMLPDQAISGRAAGLRSV